MAKFLKILCLFFLSVSCLVHASAAGKIAVCKLVRIPPSFNSKPEDYLFGPEEVKLVHPGDEPLILSSKDGKYEAILDLMSVHEKEGHAVTEIRARLAYNGKIILVGYSSAETDKGAALQIDMLDPALPDRRDQGDEITRIDFWCKIQDRKAGE